MKQYDRFGEYMFDLLFAPLKKGKRTINQFFIFFKVIGRVFDGLKEDALRVRDETNVATASPVMLPVHGEDRNMPRLAGESVEGYRTRLTMNGIIAEKGGLKEGILYALAALGYEQSRIEPVSLQDPERWAEFILYIKGSKQNGISNLDAILAEVNKVKEGSSKLYEIVLEYAATPFVESPGHLILRRFVMAWSFSHLRGGWRFDGSAHFDGDILFEQNSAGVRMPDFRTAPIRFSHFSGAGRFDGGADFDSGMTFDQAYGVLGLGAFLANVRLDAPKEQLAAPSLGVTAGAVHGGELACPQFAAAGSFGHREGVSGAVTMDNWYALDGSFAFDGSRTFNAYLKKEEL